MPLPKRLAKFNLVVTNRVLGPLARWLPGFAVVEHVGRRSGTVRHSPVNLFRHGDRFVIALTYGAGSEWVRNVQAAGEFTVITRGRRRPLTEPELVHDERRALVPAPVRLALGALDVNDFLVSRAARAGGAPAPPPSPRGSGPPRSGPPARP
jgi:deazaflavin-dependent oxidoreductase (nitroreductase family)